MRKLLHFMTVSLLAAVLVSSCKNDPKETPEPVNPVTIEVASPTAGVVLNKGETLHVNATVKGTLEMHGYERKISNLSDGGKVVLEKTSSEHALEYHIHEYWDNDVTDHSDMELEIKVTKDHDGNTETKKVSFHCMP